MTFKIRPVDREDFPQWLMLRQRVYNDVDAEFHRQEMAQFLADETKCCLLAIDGTGTPQGMVELSLRNVVDGCLTSPVGYIEGIHLEPPVRGIGLSRRLLDQAEAWFRNQGCQEIATDAEIDNEKAQRFHLHMGFKETYRIVQYRKELK